MAVPTQAQTGLGSVSFGQQFALEEAQRARDKRLTDLNVLLREVRKNPVFETRNESDRVRVIPAQERKLLEEIERIESGNLDPGVSFESIDDLIQSRAPEAVDILRSGSEEQLRLARLAREERLRPLQEADDLRAFEERQSLLGLRGGAAQEAAIGNIPVSEFDRELQRRQTTQLRRSAAAAGELGGGASLLAQQQLAGAQQADIIQKRLEDLQPLVGLSRGIRGDISTATEQGLAQEAQLQSALGTQIGNIRLGTAAPAIKATQEQAQLKGLNRIAAANQRAQTVSALAGLAGTFAGTFDGGS